MNKKYKIIYADPPWSYKVCSNKGKSRSAETYYETMEDVSKIDISQIADESCVLLMWATYPCLQEALKLGKYWGFAYKTVAFTWIKKNTQSNTNFVGMGYYTRANAGICLLFTKGKPLKRISKSVQQIIEHKIGKHSQKPNEASKRIVKLFGNVPRVELFARERDGMFSMDEYDWWDVFGNKITNSITL
jgi:N6-adenosine-specific RNA methylase IME4